MARKVVNRRALREEVEAAEKAGIAAPKKKKRATAKKTTKKTTKKKASTRASRAKEAADVRKKVFWGVFNQSLKRVATFDFDQKKEAEKKAKTLSQSGKSPHFVQKVKEPVE